VSARCRHAFPSTGALLQLCTALRGGLQGRQLLPVNAQLQGRCAGLLCMHALMRSHQTARSRPKVCIAVNILRRARAASAGWLGAREDWRYADLRAAHPRDWWWLSFFAVYLIQARLLTGQPALAGDCLLMGSCGSVMHVHI